MSAISPAGREEKGAGRASQGRICGPMGITGFLCSMGSSPGPGGDIRAPGGGAEFEGSQPAELSTPSAVSPSRRLLSLRSFETLKNKGGRVGSFQCYTPLFGRSAVFWPLRHPSLNNQLPSPERRGIAPFLLNALLSAYNAKAF